MKTNIKHLNGMLNVHSMSTLILILLSFNSNGQWTTNVNDIYNSNSGNVGIGTIAPATKLQVIGESRFGDSVNYVKVSTTGTLSFNGTGFYQVATNKYAFKQINSGNRGLYINKTNTRFELRDSLSNDLFHINYKTGDTYYKGKLGVGTTTPQNELDAEGNAVIGSTYAGTVSAPVNGLLVESQLGIGTTSLPAESRLVIGGIDSIEGGEIQLFGSPSQNHALYIDVNQDDLRIMKGNDSYVYTTNLPILIFINENGQFAINTNTPSGSAYLTVYQFTTGTYTKTGWMHSSDERLKTNIIPLQNALDKIEKLQGVSYNWKTNPNGDNQIGFIAQEVEKVFPEVIVKDDEGNYSMAHQNLVAPIVETIKEQQKEIAAEDDILKTMQLSIDNLQNENSLLESRFESAASSLTQCCMSNNSGTGNLKMASNEEIASLAQSNPNRYNEKTRIHCYLPNNAGIASLKVYSLEGVEMISLPVNAKGSNELEIAGNTLSAGTYNYLLIVDGKTIDTRQMILTN